MMVYINGEFVPEDQAKVSVFDRGFLYGDSLFETMRVCNRRLFRWHQHMERLQRGMDFLKLATPVPLPALRDAARKLLEQNQITEGLLRLTLSRGVGPRGYSPTGANSPTVVLALYPAPSIDPATPTIWRLITSEHKLAPADRIASHKTGSKLMQIMARVEAEAAGADEALLVNTNGEVAEAASANLFWLRGPVIYTAPTAVGVLPGITRAVVLEICAAQGFQVKKRLLRAEMLKGSDAMFLVNSVHGVITVESLDGHMFAENATVDHIRELFSAVLRKECGLSNGTPAAPAPSAPPAAAAS